MNQEKSGDGVDHDQLEDSELIIPIYQAIWSNNHTKEGSLAWIPSQKLRRPMGKYFILGNTTTATTHLAKVRKPKKANGKPVCDPKSN